MNIIKFAFQKIVMAFCWFPMWVVGIKWVKLKRGYIEWG